MGSLSVVRKVSKSPLFVRWCSSIELKSPWLRDNRPGPYPVTEEEKCAAAKKYGLLREEYEPYPDDGSGYGDYPKLPLAAVDSKNLYYPFHENYKLYSEPLHVDAEILTPERLSSTRMRYSGIVMLLCFLGAISLIGLPPIVFRNCFLDFYRFAEKQYPQPGVKHYTFELDVELYEKMLREKEAKCT